MSRRSKHLAPIVFLDEIDVLQMVFAAIEMALNDSPMETFGLLFGELGSRRRRPNFRVHFVQVIQSGKRKANPPSVFLDEKRLNHLSKRYNFQVLGDFHSHPDDTCSKYPSHTDLDDVLSAQYPHGGVFAIVLVNKRNVDDGNGASVIVRRKTKIVCYFGEFVVHIHFYALRDGLKAIPRNIATEKLVRRVYPRCFVRKKIHKDTIKKKLVVI